MILINRDHEKGAENLMREQWSYLQMYQVNSRDTKQVHKELQVLSLQSLKK